MQVKAIKGVNKRQNINIYCFVSIWLKYTFNFFVTKPTEIKLHLKCGY